MPQYDDATINRIIAVLEVNANQRLQKLQDAHAEIHGDTSKAAVELGIAIAEINGEIAKLRRPLP